MNTRKKYLHLRRIVMIAIRVIFFFLFPTVFSASFAGIKYICTQLAAKQPLEPNAFLITLIAIAAFTIIFGRFFCGFACAFGTYGDVLYAIGQLIRGKKPFQRLKKTGMLPDRGGIINPVLGKLFRYGKYIVLLVTVLLCFFNRSDLITNLSPWVIFSRLQAYKLPPADLVLAIVLFIAISVGMFLTPRFFCRFLCPLGAVFSLLPIAPFSTVRLNKENCAKSCGMCSVVCPAHLDLPDKEENIPQIHSECFACAKCTYSCPKDANCGAGTIPGKAKGLIWLGIKAGALLCICFLIK